MLKDFIKMDCSSSIKEIDLLILFLDMLKKVVHHFICLNDTMDIQQAMGTLLQMYLNQ